MTDYTLELDAWTGARVETLRFATRTLVTGPTEAVPNAAYRGRIMDPGMLSRSILDGGALANANVGTGSIVLNNQDGALDPLVGYGFDGRAFTLREVDGQSPAQAPAVARGVLAGIDTGDAWKSLRLRLRDGLAALQVPLLTARYAGTTTSGGLGVEGDGTLKDQIKPLALGFVPSVSPKAVNVYDLVGQVSIAPVAAIQIYDGAVPLTWAGDVPTVAALMAWIQVPGRYLTCLAAGLYRLGGSPAFAVTADVAERASPADGSAARVAARMLDRLGATYDTASFASLHAANPAPVGIFVDTDANADTLIAQVLASIGAALVPTDLGVLQAVRLETPIGDPVATITLRDIGADGELALASGPDSAGVPAWSVALTWGRVWQTISAEDAARADVTPERGAFLQVATRTATASDPAVKTAHPLAATVSLDTLLTQRVDAEAEAARLLALHSFRRDRLTLTVPDRRGRLDLGAVVAVRLPRFGFDAGKLFRVVARQDDFGKRTVRLGLWG